MGKYTSLDNPSVDQTVQDHLQQIAKAICSHIEPRAIVLRGSFSYGEGSIAVEGNSLRFLSDYELMAITPHYGHRRWLRTVAREMTTQLGVETSISRVHPQNIVHNSLGNLPIKGTARPTIAMYEVQNAGCTLYGEHLLNRGPVIDPGSFDAWVGLRLMLNRMAESLDYCAPTTTDWAGLRWVNKTLLSCADAILIVHGLYHFSYAERGRRFADLVPQLGAVTAQANTLPDLVRRATAFKLRPSLQVYPEPLPVLWHQVQQICAAALSYVIGKYLGFFYDDYAEFPQLYLSALEHRRKRDQRSLLPAHVSQNLLLMLKFVRARRAPPIGILTHAALPVWQIVYSTIPLLFLGSSGTVLQEARRWLGQVTRLDPPRAEYKAEWNYLRGRAVQAWRDLCYGMWDAVAI